MFLTSLDAPETRKKTLLQSQTQERYTLFAVPWSRRRGDCNSSAADDMVEATSCPILLLLSLSSMRLALQSAAVLWSCAAPFPSYTEQAVNMFPHTPLLPCVERSTQKSESCLLITLFVRVHPHVYLHILIHRRCPAVHARMQRASKWQRWVCSVNTYKDGSNIDIASVAHGRKAPGSMHVIMASEDPIALSSTRAFIQNTCLPFFGSSNQRQTAKN